MGTTHTLEQNWVKMSRTGIHLKSEGSLRSKQEGEPIFPRNARNMGSLSNAPIQFRAPFNLYRKRGLLIELMAALPPAHRIAGDLLGCQKCRNQFLSF